MKNVQTQNSSLVIAVFLLAMTVLPSFGASMTPLTVTGFNWDVVVENTSVGPPYTTASELNPGLNLP